MNKPNFHIKRITFDHEAQIRAAQECIKNAQLALINPAYKLSLKYFYTQPIHLVVYASICSVVSIALNRFVYVNTVLSILISVFGLTLIFLLAVYLLHRKLWFWFIDYVETKSDLTLENAHKIYSKDKNAFFAAYSSNNELISMGGILLDEEKQLYKEKYMSNLKEDEAILVRIATCTQHQGKGASKAIINECLAFAKSKGVKCVQLSQTNKQLAAYALYKKFGFITVKKYMLIGFINFYLRQMNLKL